MNLLEHFNFFHKTQTTKSFELSLLDFFKNDVSKRFNLSNATVLDLGSGPLSLFDSINLNFKKVLAIDYSPEAIKKSMNHGNIEYVLLDITNDMPDACNILKTSFNLIFDSHCVHCLREKDDRKRAFQNIFKLLSTDGIFASEMMISKSSKVVQHVKYAPTAVELENELLSYGFKIKLFVICRDIFLESEGLSFDLVRVILSK